MLKVFGIYLINVDQICSVNRQTCEVTFSNGVTINIGESAAGQLYDEATRNSQPVAAATPKKR